jgi:CheY-like chemotaxis protein
VFAPDVKRELDASRLPVLVVEDNREALFIYEKYLSGSPFQVVPARNLKEARQALREFRPVAILLDVLLEGEHSWNLLQELKQQPSTKDIPVIVVTVVENQQKAMALGATAFHSKPIDRGWLLNQLETGLPRQGGKILIIDDDEVSRYLLKGLLSNSGYRLLEARGGTEGLRLARESKPELVILDLSMPDLSGFEVLDRLKGDPETSEIPVVIHTSRTLDNGERSLLRAAVDIVPKEAESREVAGVRLAEALERAGLAPLPCPDTRVHASHSEGSQE